MTFDYDALAAAGLTKIVVSYSGHGDEGWIESIEPEPEGYLHKAVERTSYDLLEDHFGGWEINEGSSGTITIDVKHRKASIHHGWVVESTRYEDKEIA